MMNKFLVLLTEITTKGVLLRITKTAEILILRLHVIALMLGRGFDLFSVNSQRSTFLSGFFGCHSLYIFFYLSLSLVVRPKFQYAMFMVE